MSSMCQTYSNNKFLLFYLLYAKMEYLKIV